MVTQPQYRELMVLVSAGVARPPVAGHNSGWQQLLAIVMICDRVRQVSVRSHSGAETRRQPVDDIDRLLLCSRPWWTPHALDVLFDSSKVNADRVRHCRVRQVLPYDVEHIATTSMYF